MKNIFGFTLIEVLVSLALFALILLGFDVMQLTAFQMNQSAYCVTMAALQMNSIDERLKALGKENGLQDQIAIWNRQNQWVLPGGKGVVAGRFPTYSIKLCWGRDKQMHCIHNRLIL